MNLRPIDSDAVTTSQPTLSFAAPRHAEHTDSVVEAPHSTIPLPPGAVNKPYVGGIKPVQPQHTQLSEHFKVSDTQLLLTQYNTLNKKITMLQAQQPTLKAFMKQRLEQALPEQRPLNDESIEFRIYRKSADGQKGLVSTEPLLSAVARKVQETQAPVINGQEGPEESPGVESGFYIGEQKLKNLSSLRTIATDIGVGFAEANRTFWTRHRPGETSSPQNMLLAMHRELLSTQAALRVVDGTLSQQGKQLVDTFVQHPSLESREREISAGSRPGVYPLRINDNTETGSLLPGAFIITASDGSSSSVPVWPNGTRNINANELNGPVVAITSENGIEEFKTPAQALEVIAARLNLKHEIATLSEQPSPKAPQGDDLLQRLAPVKDDVIVEGFVTTMLQQTPKISEALTRVMAPENEALHPYLLSAPTVTRPVEDAADLSFQFDGSNALLARNQKLEEKLQPDWLQNLTPVQKAFFSNLDTAEQESNETLFPLLEKVPSLPAFAKQQLTQALKELLKNHYPDKGIDPANIKVSIRSRTAIHTGRFATGEHTRESVQSLSLVDLALKNLSEWDAGSSTQYSKKTMTATLLDAAGKAVLDAQGNPLMLDTQALEALIRPLDMGGKYLEHLAKEMAPDATSGNAGALRKAWYASKLANLKKEAFVAQLDPANYHATLTDNTSQKRSAHWVSATLDHTDPTTWPTVEGHEIRSYALVIDGKAVEGAFVIKSPSHPSLVLCTPNAPDGLTFRELVDQDSLKSLTEKPEWKRYIVNRTTPLDKYELIAKLTQYVPFDLVTKAARDHEIGISLKPTRGPLLDHLYQQQLALSMAKADAASTSTAEVNAASNYNKLVFGIDVASNLLDMVPVVGKGLSIINRLTKAGIKAFRAQGRSLPALLKNPNGWGAVYSDFTVAATGQNIVRQRGLRPVISPRLAITARPAALVKPAIAGPSRPASGATATQVPGAQTSARADLGEYAVPDAVLNGTLTPRNGIYLVDSPSGPRSFVRYTDSTDVNRLYEISPVYTFEGSIVRVIDPVTRRQVATMTSTGSGEWRLSQLPGGRRGARHRQNNQWPYNYVDGLLLGAPDFTLSTAARGQANRWFRDGMNEFFAQHAAAPSPRPDMPALTPNTSPSELTREALLTSSGLVLGEQHNQIASNLMLIKNMENYAKSGVTTLYLEGGLWADGLPYTEGDMDLLPDPPKNSAYIRKILTRKDVFAAAEKYGIKVRGLEHEHLTMHSTRSASDDAANLKHTTDRLKEFNYFASKIIKQTPMGEKWIAVVGRRHMNTTQGVPGIAELTGGTGIGVYDAAPGGTSIAVQSAGQVPDPARRITLNDQVGDYQILQNVDAYLRPA
ncbi:membrane-targeted effector domain-containing toxin [Pseudomonas sp. MH9.3]|uniref:membrane-targeted effector domain-containing toxin n=1 Tax=Pseudomonas sp. MH9.3 TaxID=3048630 RepID=UPI002AC8ABFC|nr:membrane-targeted effector domain-containing toxin [Pseudomonas sp. MH9.3]MEB0109575.1 membrane-targeted effector domain-containing toxin [Pseudomonas sp. MH9.3]WPX81653.1 membrane-targeted effector domain-containing toxin [Pseudomonas sp. MH9.3]